MSFGGDVLEFMNKTLPIFVLTRSCMLGIMRRSHVWIYKNFELRKSGNGAVEIQNVYILIFPSIETWTSREQPIMCEDDLSKIKSFCCVRK